MEIRELLELGTELIKNNKYSNFELEPVWILASLLDVDYSYIHTHLDGIVHKDIEDRFIYIINKRREGYPLQYLLNEQEFMGHNLYIEEGVLIPRGETEILVEYIISYIDKKYRGENINLLEIGIGSGAISLSIAKKFPNIRVIGTDIGYIPIKVSNINKEKLKINNVSFLQGDLFKALEDMELDYKFDIIISNPPYIRANDIKGLQTEVGEHEPRLALDGGKDGLNFYRKISKEGKRYLNSGGMLIYEIGYDQASEVKYILTEEGYKDISILKDFQNHDRIIFGFKS